MRKLILPVMTIVAAGLVASCSGGSLPTGTTTATPTESATDMPLGTPSTGAASTPPDAPSTVPAPSPAAPTDIPAGAGDAELSITVEPGDGAATVHYTLVCAAGEPLDESSHPNAQEACAALKANPGVLHREPNPDRVCTEQYGGPQKATVTGAVNGVPVETAFSRHNGCEISAWDAAKDLLGADGGSV